MATIGKGYLCVAMDVQGTFNSAQGRGCACAACCVLAVSCHKVRTSAGLHSLSDFFRSSSVGPREQNPVRVCVCVCVSYLCNATTF